MPKITPGLSAQPIRKKQMMMLGGGLLVVVAIVLLATIFTQESAPKPPPPAPKFQEKSFVTPGEGITDAEKWRIQEGTNIEAIRQELSTMRAQLEAAKATKETTPPPAPPAPVAAATTPPPPEPPSLGPTAVPPVSPQGGPLRGSAGLGAPGGQIPAVKSLMNVDIMDATSNAKAAAEAKAEATKRTAENFLPTGTFIRAINLSGLDAPTGGQAQNDPHPIVFRLVDHAILPNKFRANMKECFISGDGYGDISSERAYIRLDRLSCIDESGGAIDTEIKGYISGEDGKAGMRGRLIEKQGQVLANALLAGVASGIGKGFAANATTTSTGVLGTVSTVEQGKAFQSGVGTGVGNALDQLSRYYIQLAEKLFPVIEIDAGRTVDIVLTRGMTIERQ